MNKLFGGIEAGGTKFVCMAGTDPDNIDREVRFPTTSPQETINQVIEFFSPYYQQNQLLGIGIGSFGPVDLQKSSSKYGYITSTPKPGWQNTNLCGEIAKAINVPIVFDTDVNAAAFGELYWSGAKEVLDPFVYVTVGTGIGVGVVANQSPIHGLVHTEGGHMLIPQDKSLDPFDGICPYHKNCLEGLASGPAIKARWNLSAQDLPDNHPAWDLEARYIALAICNIVMMYSPMRIVVGGGVAQHPGLLDSIREKTLSLVNNYVQSDILINHISDYIVTPALGNQSGVLGAIALAASAYKEE